MKRIFINVVLFIFLINLTGCKEAFLPQAREIDDLQLIQVIGIDKPKDSDNGCLLTVASKRLRGGGQESQGGGGEGGGNMEPKALVLTAEGKTVFDAVRKLQTHSDKTLFWGHSEYYLIGEEAARENIVKYIDFFARDHELRIDAKVYVVKGSTAGELINQFNESDFYIADKLESLGRNIKLLSISEEIKISQIMRFIDIHFGSARVPCIYLTNRTREGNRQIIDIEVYGYAIVSDLKLKGYLGRDISRGVNLITNHLNSSVVAVKDLSGQDASLEIVQSNTRIKPFFNGDKLESVTIETTVESNLTEIQAQKDITNEESIIYMENQQSKILENEIKSVIEKIIEFKSDCLGICDGIRLKSPFKWKKLEKNWLQIIPKIKFYVQVKSRIERTYDIDEPSGYKREVS